MGRRQNAFTLVEVMVMVLLMGVVMTAGSMVFICGQNLLATTSTQSDLQTSVVQALQRISFELQDSGKDSSGNLKVSVLDNAGAFNTDILRFSIPLCVCGISPIDANGNVSAWGAPLIWGQNNCDGTYPTGSNGKVDICHHPPGNPNNSNTLNVSPNAIKAHLAHGDTIGACDSCSTSGYTNRTIEYRVDNSYTLNRNILDTNNAVLTSSVIGQKISGFQTVIGANQDSVTVTVQATGTGDRQRPMVVTNNVDVLLRNR